MLTTLSHVVGGGERDKPVDGRAARWAGQREKRRAEIVAAALTAVAEHGPWVSTERIAEVAGISRPRLYRHFTDADDLYGAVGRRIGELLVAAMAPPLTEPRGSTRDVIARVVRTFVEWLTEHRSLYEYVVSRSVADDPGRRQPAADVRAAIAGLLRDLLGGYLGLLDVDTRIADPLAFGLVGMVEAAAARWSAEPGGTDLDELVDHVSRWVWALVDDVLRQGGVALDPDVPLPPLPR
ncbi:TetR/AcrR family transcriptional regulator [Saccharothrix obliqua]|uniref:TetR/AcrR family transcriptional regulator n=1 Tax=Saccharothrix obliqua TaxID=2861747 RepID=UPI0027E2596E|nr:TetR/AcrR family transcriptional regulator [Saccharothrix obliqua]